MYDHYNHEDKFSENRRFFLKKIVKNFFLFSFFLFSILVLSILKPQRPKRREYTYCEIGEDKIPKEGVKRINIDTGNMQRTMKIYIVNIRNSIIALSPVCTHLGCFVNFDKNSNEFICPCHGGKYNIEGKVVAGPPKIPLQRLPVKIEDKRIFIGIPDL